MKLAIGLALLLLSYASQYVSPPFTKTTTAGGITVVSDWQTCDGSGSCTITLTTAASAGNTIWTFGDNNGGCTATTDSQGNTYTAISSADGWGGSQCGYYILSSGGAVTTVTNNCTAFCIGSVIVLSGVTGLDGTPICSGSGLCATVAPASSSFNTGNITTSHVGILLGMLDCEAINCTTVTPAAGWSAAVEDAFGALWVSRNTTTGAGTYSFSGTSGTVTARFAGVVGLH